MRNKILLVCNAHIDPVWLWEWPEGLAETLATFRQAAKFCDDNESFVFCHNEAILYEWIKEYDPALFRKIKILVAKQQWVIIGGWYLQPDCNLPSGESFIRQITRGREFFTKEFGITPSTSVNFDSFGHSRGLVQILKKSGFDSYLFCRPGTGHLDLPDDFVWVGFDGSSILAHRSTEHYNSPRGKAADKIKQWISAHPNQQIGLVLWGIGNHGGGPSSKDLNNIRELQSTLKSHSIEHSHPEAFFSLLKDDTASLPKVSQDLNPWAVGCYTSMARVKKMHRRLEHDLYLTEKMLTQSWLQYKQAYPASALAEALDDLLFCEFHDILPGSGTPEVETYALRRMSHALEILERLRIKAFFTLCRGQKPAKTDEFPVFVFNPFPFETENIVVCELQGPEPNFDPDLFLTPVLFGESGEEIDCQLEKESSNIRNDHRKRIVFKGKLKPSGITRFSCWLNAISILEKPLITQHDLNIDHMDCQVCINSETGLIDYYKTGEQQWLGPDAGFLMVMDDDADPWGMTTLSYTNPKGRFRLASPAEAAGIAGTNGPIAPVRIIEEGKVRTVVESIFIYKGSSAVIHYKIPQRGSAFEISLMIHWDEKDSMLKYVLPGRLNSPLCKGQVSYGVQEFDRQNEESLAHRWVALIDEMRGQALAVINNSSYGFDFEDSTLRISLLRAPAYAGHPIGKDEPIVPQDRYTRRMDSGYHHFSFSIEGGSTETLLNQIDAKSLLFNETQMTLCLFPAGRSTKSLPFITFSNPSIRLAAVKRSGSGASFVIRLYEPTGKAQFTDVAIPTLNMRWRCELGPFEIKTIMVDPTDRSITETNLTEEVISKIQLL